MSDGTVSVGVVGLGYRGPNLARNFDSLPGVQLRWCCDARAEVRERLQAQYRATRFTTSLDDLLDDASLDAIVLATPVPRHAALTVREQEASRRTPGAPRGADADGAPAEAGWTGHA